MGMSMCVREIERADVVAGRVCRDYGQWTKGS